MLPQPDSPSTGIGVDFRREVRDAYERIRRHVRETPLECSSFLSSPGVRVHLKLENLQRTGSFKLRGAMNKLLTLSADERRRGVVAASTGNHGLAVATGAALLECPALIFAPASASETKLDAVRAAGAEVRVEGADCVEAEQAARAHAKAHGLAYVSPYNDAAVVAGQGTVGLEIERQLEGRCDAVVVAVGGGGLVSGVGGYLKGGGRKVTVVGASPRNSAVMHASLEAGEIVDRPSKPTLSDGTAGGIEAGSITFGRCHDVIDEFVLVDEDAIAAGVRTVVTRHYTLVEGAAGVAVAALEACRPRLSGNVVVILCGANIAAEALVSCLTPSGSFRPAPTQP